VVAVRERLTTAARLADQIADFPKLSGRAELVRLLGLLVAGCHSWLEMFGVEHVFSHPSLPPSRGQVEVKLGKRTVYLDRLFELEKVVAELDGSALHSSAADRERDIRRDAALAALGYLVVRYTYQRLIAEPEAVRAELLQILTMRRHQLHVA